MEADGPTLDDIARLAKRGWFYRLLIIGVLSGGVSPIIASVLGDNSVGSHSHHKAVHPAALVIVSGLSVVAVVGAVLLYREVWRGEGRFAPLLAFGLPRSQRRAVVRAVRSGDPSEDFTMRTVETNMAQKITGQAKWSVVIFPAMAALALTVGLVQRTDNAAKWYYVATSVLFVVAFALTVRIRIGARRYIVRLERGTGHWPTNYD